MHLYTLLYHAGSLLLLAGVTVTVVVGQEQGTRFSRRPLRPRDTPNQPLGNSQQNAFVLNLGSFRPASQEVVSLFEESLRELVMTSGRQVSVPRSPTVAAEFDQGIDRYTILCISILGDAMLDGLKVIDDPRRKTRDLARKEHVDSSNHPSNRDLRRRRRDDPYYVTYYTRRSRKPFSAANLLTLINLKASSSFKVEALFGTDSTICGDLGSPVPASPTGGPTNAPSRSPNAQPTTENPTKAVSSNPSIADSSIPSTYPSFNPTTVPSTSPEPTRPLPTVSSQPSVSIAPSLPPPDWEQFGNTIKGVTKQKIVFSDDGTLLGTIFTKCTDNKPCGQLYQNTNVSNWIPFGQGVSAATSNSQVTDLSLAGDGSRVAFISVDMEPDDANLQTRRVQVFRLIADRLQAIGGGTLIDRLDYSDSSKTSVCLSTDGSMVTMSMGSIDVIIIQAWSIQSGIWTKLGDVFNTTDADVDATVEYSDDCRTAALVDISAQSYIYNLVGASWTSRQTGFPSTKFASLSLDGSGSTVAARSFSQTAGIDIYEFSGNVWQLTGSIARGQVFESNFGYNLDLSSNGETVAIATFRNVGTSTISCTQAFQYKSTDWEPLGRPPCLSFGDGHAGFGAILALSGEGLTMAVGDVGSFIDQNERGHIHTYQFFERG